MPPARLRISAPSQSECSFVPRPKARTWYRLPTEDAVQEPAGAVVELGLEDPQQAGMPGFGQPVVPHHESPGASHLVAVPPAAFDALRSCERLQLALVDRPVVAHSKLQGLAKRPGGLREFGTDLGLAGQRGGGRLPVRHLKDFGVLVPPAGPVRL